jgi:hypothetical protein
MNLISIDVGIKNLAYCLFSLTEENKKSLSDKKSLESDKKSFKVEKWGVIDLSQKTEVQRKCSCFNEKKPTKKNPHPKKEKCIFPAKWKKEEEYFCVKHAKKSNYMIPTKQTSIPFITKQKMEYLNKLIAQYHIVLQENKKYKKEELISLLKGYLQTHSLEFIEEVNASKLDLVTIGRNLKTKFNLLFSTYTIDKVIIENQISPIANRMKTIQGMISQYFIMVSENDIEIDFVSSTNKLKLGENMGATDYKERKKQSIQLVKDSVDPIWIDFFNSHSKKDDLSDSYLQGVWYIKNKLSL